MTNEIIKFEKLNIENNTHKVLNYKLKLDIFEFFSKIMNVFENMHLVKLNAVDFLQNNKYVIEVEILDYNDYKLMIECT